MKSIAGKLHAAFLRLSQMDRIRIQTFASLGPALLLVPLLLLVEDKLGPFWAIGGAMLVLPLVVMFLTSVIQRMGEFRSFIVGTTTLVICWFVSAVLFVWYFGLK